MRPTCFASTTRYTPAMDGRRLPYHGCQPRHIKERDRDEHVEVLLMERGDVDAILEETYLEISRMDPAEEIQMVRSGVPARMIASLARDMGVSRARMLDWIKMPEATAERKIKNDELLDTAWSERVLALAALIGRVQHMVEESGDPIGFDAAAWIGSWLSGRLGQTRKATWPKTPAAWAPS